MRSHQLLLDQIRHPVLALARDRSPFHQETAFGWDNVLGDAPNDRADIDGSEGRIELFMALRCRLARNLADSIDDRDRIQNCRSASLWKSAMSGFPRDYHFSQ